MLDVDKKGQIDYGQLEDLLKDGTQQTLVSIMHGNNEIGTMADIAKIGQMCKEQGAFKWWKK